MITTGTAHAAVSFGANTPTINGVAFEQSAANTGDVNIPAGAEWSGTNWQLQRGSEAAAPLSVPGFGNNTGRLEVTAFADLPDPSFGQIAGVQDLCEQSIRRNHLLTFSGLPVGNRAYILMFFGTYPNSATRATLLETEHDGALGDSVSFGVDGVDSILSKGIRRYGFTITDTTVRVLKSSPDASGSYCNGAMLIDMGPP